MKNTITLRLDAAAAIEALEELKSALQASPAMERLLNSPGVVDTLFTAEVDTAAVVADQQVLAMRPTHAFAVLLAAIKAGTIVAHEKQAWLEAAGDV